MSQTVPCNWLWIALGELGQKTLPGKKHNLRIIDYHATTKLRATSDEVPWGSSFVNWCMVQANIKGTESALAESWLSWGASCGQKPGAVAILHNSRAAQGSQKITGNQVGFLLGETDTSYVLLGGDQGGQVDVGAFTKSAWQLKGCRWPIPAQAASTTSNLEANAVPQAVPYKWLWIALGEVGQKSLAGTQHNPRIIKYHAATTMKMTSDETAWDSSFINWCMADAGVKGSGSAMAESWLTWGNSCEEKPGAVAILQDAKAARVKPGASGYKVGFLLGETDSDYVLLGGDQDGQVKASTFSKSAWKLKGYRWPVPRPLTMDEKNILTRLEKLGAAAKAEGTEGATFQASVDEFRMSLQQRLNLLNQGEAVPPDIRLIMSALLLWSNDSGDQWGEGSYDSKALHLSAPKYATVPASQYKCNAYVAEAIYMSLGQVFLVHEADNQKGKYFPYQAKEWGDSAKAIPGFVVVGAPVMGDVWSNGSHTGIYLGAYGGKKLYISARDDGGGVFGLKAKVQYAHGIQIKYLPDGGVYRRYTP